MKIAQIAPLIESVPPRLYGGTERVVSYLTEELVRRGHEVTLFASADSRTSARLVSCVPRALRLDSRVKDPMPYALLQLEQVRKLAPEFDVLHFHTDLLHFPILRSLRARSLTTLHGRLDLPDLPPLYDEFQDMPLVSVSNHQRKPLPRANWIATVYHGLPRAITRYFPAPAGGYLAFLGRISPEKGPDRAIAIARRLGMKLRIAAKVDRVDADYFRREIEPLLSHPLVEFIGEIGERDKPDFLGNALALLFPVDWPEPFGLVMIESMACGTPVVAYARGSVPEIVEDGVTGFIARDEDSAVEAVRRVETLDRARVRRRFEQRFTVERMADDYLAVYRRLGAPLEMERTAA
ncbi:MAG TPA: glycosyltransferase family 4 protein [Burkholderiales bacterium]|nr:glycosyltransferase family 4 protein [Burkholderiales bacterium]